MCAVKNVLTYVKISESIKINAIPNVARDHIITSKI